VVLKTPQIEPNYHSGGDYGTCIAGPGIVYWYRFLNRRIHAKTPAGSVIARVAMDQLIFAPSFLFLFFTANGVMQGQSNDDIKTKLLTSYPSALVANYQLWPMVQLANFTLVPLNYQALLVNTVALGWNTYLSYKSNNKG
jgi:protein Mpv17